MTPAEAAALLAVAAAFDNRKPDADAAMAWSLALDGLPFTDCRDAIVAHYRGSTDWVMPDHVRTAVKKVRSGRLETAAPSTPPEGMDADDVAGYLRWLAAERQSIADGNPPSQPPALPSRNMGALKALMPSVPAVTTSAPTKDPEWQRRKEAARAELDELRGRLHNEAADLVAANNPGLRNQETT